jgi:hypothetical protein
MSVTAAEIAAVPSYTTAQKIAWLEAQYMEAARNVGYTINGRTITRQTLQALSDEIARLKEQQQIEAATTQGGGNVLVAFGEEQ